MQRDRLSRLLARTTDPADLSLEITKPVLMSQWLVHASDCRRARDMDTLLPKGIGLSMSQHEELYPRASRELAEQRKRLAPRQNEAFQAFSQSVFAEGAIAAKTKQLIAVALAHVTQCPYCIHAHTRAAVRRGVTAEEIMEAIWVAAEMRAGGAYAHSTLALNAIRHYETEKVGGDEH